MLGSFRMQALVELLGSLSWQSAGAYKGNYYLNRHEVATYRSPPVLK